MDIIYEKLKNKPKKQINKEKLEQILHIYKTIKMSYPLKRKYNNIIPLNIYQTWHTKILPPKMNEAINNIKQNNPCFTHFLFDDNDCREFISKNFDNNVLNAFDKLIPGAYKADLWRYCILYINGGIYLDVKYKPVKNFKLINLTEKEHFVMDRDNYGIYNALMVTLPKNEYLLTAIKCIVQNVNNKFYGSNCLEPTGPHLLAKIIPKNSNLLDMRHDFYENMNNRYIIYNNFLVFKSYSEYLMEHGTYSKKAHYSHLWSVKNIYL